MRASDASLSKRYSSAQIIAALGRAGFDPVSQRGSHLKLSAAADGRVVIVKHPAGEVPAGTFASILRQAGLSRREFEQLL
jgi:predicted RNA binding protein YcfA (HicA-like mRNA interferase family)